MTDARVRYLAVLTAPEQATGGDVLWDRLRQEAAEAAGREPALAGLFAAAVLEQPDFAVAVARRLAAQLAAPDLSADLLAGLFHDALARAPATAEAFRADIIAVVERDPATDRLLEPFLYFKGWAALQTHRLAHALWTGGRREAALVLQSRSSAVFQTDIHPAAYLGTGVFLDHATGFVAGETVIVENNVSLLQNVTLGGTGTRRAGRHPHIREGSLVGAGAKVLGDISVGPCARVAAGSVVVRPVPEFATVAGNPARVVATNRGATPWRDMDQGVPDSCYSSFNWVI